MFEKVTGAEFTSKAAEKFGKLDEFKSSKVKEAIKKEPIDFKKVATAKDVAMDLNSGKIIQPDAILKPKTGLFGKLKSAFGKVGSGLKNAGSKVLNGLKTGISKIGSAFKNSKIGSALKGKGGKIGLAVAGIALLAAGGKYLYDKLTDKKDPEQQPVSTEQQAAAPVAESDEQAVDETAKEETTAAAASQAAAPDESPVPEEAPDESAVLEEDENAMQEQIPTQHTVVKGDNMWNIAKQDLIANNSNPDYKPSNAEILKRTKELMALNGLEFEPDGYHVMIRPNDTIRLVA